MLCGVVFICAPESPPRAAAAHKTDMVLSTLASYIEAMGGKLDICA
jgi:hypothetical protein